MQIMNTLLFFLYTLIIPFAGASGGYDLTVTVDELRSDDGQVYIALFNNGTDYPKKEYKVTKVKISNKKVVYTFSNIPKGTYAVSTFHDANANNKLDTNPVGMPKEDYGFSNNASSTFGPPSFDKASFALSKNTSITIHVH